MGSIEEISQLCRLCLIKDQVNVPIFDETSDINETFVKINSCLPVKVSPDDNLPKKICDGCSYKLDMLYIFRNTSAESEQQLVAWLDEAGLASCGLPQTSIKESNTKSEILVKQEAFEATDPRVEDDTSDAHSYILQQQKLPYQQEFTFVEATASGSGLVSDEPPLKRPKRAAALKKISVESEDLEATMQITKAEDDDSDDADQPDYIEAPSTSADDQPGPSGVEKGTIDAPTTDRVQTIIIEVSPQPEPEYVSHTGEQFTCKRCSKTFKSRSGCIRHIRTIHRNERKFKCPDCPHASRNSGALKAHIVARHTRNFPYRCDICNMGYMSHARVEYHKKAQHEGYRFVCEFCNKVFKHKETLGIHMRAQHLMENQQHLNAVRVKLKNSSPKRKDIQKKDPRCDAHRQFMCDVCGVTLFSKQALIWHLKSHTGTKDFFCEICGIGFVKKAVLMSHIRTHTKEKPYTCPYCEKSFAQKSTLNVHMYLHTEKPYKCGECGKSFSRRHLWTQHCCKTDTKNVVIFEENIFFE